MAVPRRQSGGMMTLTRLPSWRRASASGVVWSTRRPTLLTMRWAIWSRCSSSRNWIWASSSLPLLLDDRSGCGPLTMMSLISGSLSSSSSGPRPSSSSTSTFSSANCSRRLRLIFSSASTSPMIGRNSSASSSLERVAAASGSTRSSRRGSTCSLIRWIEASKPSLLLDWPCSPDCAWRSARRAMASPRSIGGGRRRCRPRRRVDRARSAGTGSPPSARAGAGRRALHRLGGAEARPAAAVAAVAAASSKCTHGRCEPSPVTAGFPCRKW